MDFVLSTLGMPFPSTLGARSVVMKNGRLGRRSSQVKPLAFIRHHRDSLLCLNMPLSFDKNYEDDDTASTTSSNSDSSSDHSSMVGSVSFADPLVTDVYVRPTTTKADKNELYYSDSDFRTFRRDYYLSRQTRHRDTVVSFSETVVSGVHTYACPDDKDVMYYSESDLKRFLEDFVSSLHESSVCEG